TGRSRPSRASNGPSRPSTDRSPGRPARRPELVQKRTKTSAKKNPALSERRGRPSVDRDRPPGIRWPRKTARRVSSGEGGLKWKAMSRDVGALRCGRRASASHDGPLRTEAAEARRVATKNPATMLAKECEQWRD